MLVASGVEFGGEGEGALAPPPQVIGYIRTAIGCGTIKRASAIAIEAAVGDRVYPGDIIETAADGRIGICFVDGTVFDLSDGACVELGEFVCESDRNSHSAQFVLTRGTFGLVAGRQAKRGCLVDTPFGSIRSRGHAGGVGMLSLAALVFSAIKEVQAADPNVTFLDDDSIAYKDLEHGVFELTTKEAVPRHIIVEDPGETVVLSRRGSSVSVNQVANSAARMEELQAAQQDALANYAKGFGPNGSGTPPFDKSLPLLHPINFIQPDAPAEQQLLPPLQWTAFVIPEILIVHKPPPPPPPPPTLNVGAGPTEIDTVVFDTFTAASGTFAASSSISNATLTFGISGGTAGNTTLGGITYDISETGLYGTLYLNTTTGAYAFVPNNDAINALKANTTQSFIVTVSDGTFSVDQTFNIPIVGADDAAIISGATTGSVVGTSGVTNASPGLLITTGTLTDTDVDDPPNTFRAVSSPTKSAGGYGTFTMTAAGVWTYTLDDANSAVRALNVGDTLTDSFTVTTIDGTSQVVTITVHGPLIAATGTAPSLMLSETHLTATALDDNIAGSAPNVTLTTASGNFSTAFNSVQGVDGATISYALGIAGGNGTASGLIDSHTGLADVLVLNGNTIEGRVGTAGGVLAFTITLDPTTGLVTFTEYRAVTQPFGTNPDGGEGLSLTAGIVNLTATITATDGNFQTESIDLGSRLTITDDGPSIAATGTGPSLTLSEAHLTATALDDNIAGSAPNAAQVTTVGDFATAFTSVQGADGATISYALSITGGNGTASGLIDSHTGLADVLVLNGNTIEGRVGTAGGVLAFTITLDPTTGLVTFTEYRAVTQPFGTNPDGAEGVSLTAGIVNLVATITDKDGDFQTASLDLGKQLTITDDGPSIRATGSGPSLTLSEAHLTATALDDNIAGSAPNAALMTTMGDFSTAFTSVQGADRATISYALSITGGNGTASGLIDSHTGVADVLVRNGNTIEGHVGTTSGALAFTIMLDPTTGLVTFTDYRAVTQPFGTNPDGGEGVSLTAGIVNLVATITDQDGDFQTASLDLGKQLTITDDGPTIGGFQDTTIAARDNQIVNGTYNVSFGADGEAAMLVAVHNGAVGSTGYNLATSNLGGGITSVHVTGNGDDYTFYYSTHAVNGGVELDAYFTNANGTLTDPYFKLLINPDGTYSFDVESVELLKQVTVTGSSFGASGGGTPSLTAPDGQLVITGSDNSGHPLDVKASNNGIAVGDTGLQMDPNEDLHLSFLQEQPQVSFTLTQWQGNGTADVIFRILDGTTDIHDFNINIPKPSGGTANIVVQETSNAALIDTYTFDRTTSTYTLYVGQTFNQIQVDYDQAAGGNATFAVNNITYNETSIVPSTDLLFDVSAVDGDGDSAATSLQVDLQGGTAAATSLALTSTLGSNVLVGSSNDPTTITSGTTIGSVTETGGATTSGTIATGAIADTGIDDPPGALTTVSSPTKSDRGYGISTVTAVSTWGRTPDNNSAVNVPNIGDTLTDVINGVFAAVLLTGSNGSDAFGKSSVAHSNAARFDTITDFASGYDKIDLTAFGGLRFVFLALTPTSTSVPAHTIAWLYDSAANHTIVYVNPTDQALSIGDTGLVEVHLQGCATLQASDFILEHPPAAIIDANATIDPTAATQNDAIVAASTAADVSSDATVSGAPHADTSWRAQATSISYVEAALNQIDSTDHLGFPSFGEVETRSSQHTADYIEIAPPSGRPIELPHGALAAAVQSSFTFDQTAALENAVGMTIGHEVMTQGPSIENSNWILPSSGNGIADSDTSSKDEGHGLSVPKSTAAMNEANAHAHGASDAGVPTSNGNGKADPDTSSKDEDHGPLVSKSAAAMNEANAHAHGASDAGDPSALEHAGGDHSISSEAGENGAASIHGGDAHDIQSPSIAHLVFGQTPGTTGIEASFHFKDEITAPEASGTSKVAELGEPPGQIVHHENAPETHGPEAISESAQATELPLSAQHLEDSFNIVASHAGGAAVAHVPHDLMV